MARRILARYGNIDGLKNAYIEYIISGSADKETQMFFEEFPNRIRGIDVKSADFILRDKKIIRLLDGIVDKKIMPLYIVNSSKIKQEVASTLSKREADIVNLRWGINDGKKLRLEDVAKKINVTRERIRQIEVKVVRKLKIMQKKVSPAEADMPDEVKKMYIQKIISKQNVLDMEKKMEWSKEEKVDFQKEIARLINNEQVAKETEGNIQSENVGNKEENIERDLSISVSEMEMPKKYVVKLSRLGIVTVEDLLQKSIKDLKKLPRLGEKTISDIVSYVHENGYKFSWEQRHKVDNEEKNIY